MLFGEPTWSSKYFLTGHQIKVTVSFTLQLLYPWERNRVTHYREEAGWVFGSGRSWRDFEEKQSTFAANWAPNFHPSLHDTRGSKREHITVVFEDALLCLSVCSTAHVPYLTPIAGSAGRRGMLFLWRNCTSVQCLHHSVDRVHRMAPREATRVIRAPNNRHVPFMTPYTVLLPGVGQGHCRLLWEVCI
jgi:hypothetical protein